LKYGYIYDENNHLSKKVHQKSNGINPNLSIVEQSIFISFPLPVLCAHTACPSPIPAHPLLFVEVCVANTVECIVIVSLIVVCHVTIVVCVS
jgi:hypothetical protein